MTRKVLFINLGWEQEPLLKYISSQGYRLFGYHWSENYVQGVPYEDVCVGDVRDLEKILAFAKSAGVDAVISDACDYSYFAQAYLSESLQLRGPTISQAQVAVNKLLQRQKARDNGIRVPVFFPAYTYNDVVSASEMIGYPLIIKPVDNRGSFGVFKVSSHSQLKECFLRSISMSHSRLVLVEECIDGREFTVDGYCIEGKPTSLAVASKSHSPSNPCVATNIVYSSDIKEHDKLCEYNQWVAETLGFTFGMIHAEYIVDRKGDVYLIEMANRGGGVFTSSLIVPAFSGIDIISLYVNDCLGNSNLFSLDLNRPLKKKVILHFFSYPSGKVKNVLVPKDILDDQKVLKLQIMVVPGQDIPAIASDAHRHGFVIATLDQTEDEAELLSQLYNKVKVEYE